VTKEFGTGAAEIIQAEILRLLQQKVSYWVTERQNEDLFL
jgi:hypothetical protein